MSCKPELQDLAAALEPLQDVLDVMRQRRNGLADGRQALRLDHGLMVTRVLDGQGGLVGDGDGQLQMIFGEAAAASAAHREHRAAAIAVSR